MTTLVKINGTILIGRIYNTTYASYVTNTVITYKNTCSECICAAFLSTVPPLYIGLNCYTNNKTCYLFTNYSSQTVLKSDLNSIFIFTKQPPYPVATNTTNICTSAYSHSTILLYLDMNSHMSWTLYNFNYTAPTNVTSVTLIFSFRSDPTYWFLDDVSVTNSSGQQLLSNGNFEQGTFGKWVSCNPNNATYSGYISSSYLCDGYYCYRDGSIGIFDYLSQKFNVTANKTYNIQFQLALDPNYDVNSTYALISIAY